MFDFDIGAKTGFFSFVFVMGDIVTPVKLYLFGPIPKLYKYLSMRFGCANVHNFALSSQAGKQILKLSYINDELYDTRATLSSNDTEVHQTGYDELICL